MKRTSFYLMKALVSVCFFLAPCSFSLAQEEAPNDTGEVEERSNSTQRRNRESTPSNESTESEAETEQPSKDSKSTISPPIDEMPPAQDSSTAESSSSNTVETDELSSRKKARKKLDEDSSAEERPLNEAPPRRRQRPQRNTRELENPSTTPPPLSVGVGENTGPESTSKSNALADAKTRAAFDKASDRTCLLLSRDTQIESKDGSKSLPIRQGRIVPSIGKNMEKRAFLIHLMQGDFYVGEADVRIGTPGLCSVEPLCAETKLDSNIYGDPDFKAKKMAKVGKGSQLNWFGRRKIKKTNTVWFQVEAGDGFGWIEASATELRHEACEGSVGSLKKRTGWNVQIDAYSETGVSSKDYESVITEIPDPSDVQGLVSPLITKFSKGSGSRAGLNFNITKSLFSARFGFAYAKTNFKYYYRKNPGTTDGSKIEDQPPVALESLPEMEQAFIEEKLIGTTGIGISDTFWGWLQINTHLGSDFQFYFKERKLEWTIYTGERIKTAETAAVHKPSQFVIDPWAELRITFLFGRNSSSGLSLIGRYSSSGSILGGLGLQF